MPAVLYILFPRNASNVCHFLQVCTCTLGFFCMHVPTAFAYVLCAGWLLRSKSHLEYCLYYKHCPPLTPATCCAFSYTKSMWEIRCCKRVLLQNTRSVFMLCGVLSSSLCLLACSLNCWIFLYCVSPRYHYPPWSLLVSAVSGQIPETVVMSNGTWPLQSMRNSVSISLQWCRGHKAWNHLSTSLVVIMSVYVFSLISSIR